MKNSWAFWIVAATALAGCDSMDLSLSPQGGTSFGDEEFTIRLMVFTGSNHIQLSDDYCKKTQAATGWKNLRAIHKDGGSDLIVGQYRSVDAAQSDLRRAHDFKAPATGQKLYASAIVVELPGVKTGPRELDLAHVTTGVYTVQIAVYLDDPKQNAYGRKMFAVERAKQLRQEGWEAYYFHGVARSAVCIGLFGPESVALKPSNPSMQIVDPNAEKYVMVDPKMREIRAKFPLLAVNDRQESIRSFSTETGKWEMVPTESCVIKIPRGGPRGHGDGLPGGEPLPLPSRRSTP